MALIVAAWLAKTVSPIFCKQHSELKEFPYNVHGKILQDFALAESRAACFTLKLKMEKPKSFIAYIRSRLSVLGRVCS